MGDHSPTVVPRAEWLAEGEARYGTDRRAWRFRCPSCGHVQSGQALAALGVTDWDAFLGFTCVGYFRALLEGRGGVVLPGQRDRGVGCTYEGGDEGSGIRCPVFVQSGETSRGVPVGNFVFEFA